MTVFFVFEEMNRNIQLLKTQKEKDIKDKEKLKWQVLEKKTKNVKHLTIGCKKQRYISDLIIMF